MSRRIPQPQLEFGSDSFLDVVCNIVGILIILIVVVAVRVQRQPDQLAASREAKLSAARIASHRKAEQDAAELSALERIRATISDEQQTLQEQYAKLSAEEQQLMEDLKQVSEEKLRAESQHSDQQIRTARLRNQLGDAERERDAVTARLTTLRNALEDKQHLDLESNDSIAVVRNSTENIESQQRTILAETQRLYEILERTRKSAEPRNRLNHRLSPVTKPVESGELHFRVSQHRISRIPLDELLERWKSQIISRRSAMMRTNQLEGRVGPVHGYFMDYLVEKDGPSTLEALRNGETTTRVSMSRWTLTVDSSLEDEPVSEAVRPGSRFRQAIETAPPDSVVTIWIYSDSFSSFSALRETAHGLQLRVAARPLPEGTPIVGSPNGSKSTAQ